MNDFYLSAYGSDKYTFVTSNSEYDGEYPNSIEFESNTKFEITKNTFFNKEIEFPFSDCMIKKIEFPVTLKKIGSNAFRALSCLEEVVFSNGYSEEFGERLIIGEGAFSANGNFERYKNDYTGGKSKLSKVILPDYVTLNIGCYDIDNKSGHPPFWKTPWSENMFEYEFKQNAILIHTNTGSNASIKYLFPNLKTANVKDMESIPENYFKDYSSLVKVSNFENIKFIGNSAFENCSNLKEIKLDNVEKIGDNAFKGCISLTSITLNNIKSIGYAAFKDCRGLKEIKLNNAKVGIGKFAFENCSKLKCINISGFIIEYGTINGCDSLEIENILNELKKQITKSSMFNSKEPLRTFSNMLTKKQPSIWRINGRRKNRRLISAWL